MDKKSLLLDYVRLLDLIEDYYTDGRRKKHERRPGQLRLPVKPDLSAGAPLTPFKWQVPTAHREVTVAEEVGNVAAGAALAALAGEIAACTRCPLHRQRRLAVAGTGTYEPLVMVIGEPPDSEEDSQGLPFTGEAGEYMDKWLNAVQWGSGKTRPQVLKRGSNTFLTPIIKCHTPAKRGPAPEELAACLPYLERQIALLKPKAILTAGRFAPEVLLKRTDGIDELRGKLYRYLDIPLIPTYHPEAVLRSPQLRSLVWYDLKLLITSLEKA